MIDPSSLNWEPNGDAEDEGGADACLVSTIQIGSMLLHLEAHQVEMRDGIQVTLQHEEDLDLIYTGVGGQGPWTTIEMHGRDYVLIATPFCD